MDLLVPISQPGRRGDDRRKSHPKTTQNRDTQPKTNGAKGIAIQFTYRFQQILLENYFKVISRQNDKVAVVCNTCKKLINDQLPSCAGAAKHLKFEHAKEHAEYTDAVRQKVTLKSNDAMSKEIEMEFDMNYKRVLFRDFFKIIEIDSESKALTVCRNCKTVARVSTVSCCTSLMKHLKSKHVKQYGEYQNTLAGDRFRAAQATGKPFTKPPTKPPAKPVTEIPQASDLTAPSQSILFKHHFRISSRKGNRASARCKHCTNKMNVTGNIKNTSNFAKHLKQYHAVKYNQYQTELSKRRSLNRSRTMPTESTESTEPAEDDEVKDNDEMKDDAKCTFIDEVFDISSDEDDDDDIFECYEIDSDDDDVTPNGEQFSVATQQTNADGLNDSDDTLDASEGNENVSINANLVPNRNPLTQLKNNQANQSHTRTIAGGMVDPLGLLSNRRALEADTTTGRMSCSPQKTIPRIRAGRNQAATGHREPARDSKMAANAHQPISQTQFDNALLNLVINQMVPFSFVESDVFKAYTNLISSGNASQAENSFKFMPIDTIKTRITDNFQTTLSSLIEKLSTIDHVSTITNVTSIGNKRFLGMTVHWIDPDSLQQESRALCYKRFYPPYSADRLDLMVSAVNHHFDIANKMRGTFTSKPIDFELAFKALGITFEENTSDASDQFMENNDNGDGNECEIQNDHSYAVPIRNQCATQLLHLVLTLDANRALQNTIYAKICRSAIRKLNHLFRVFKRTDAIIISKAHDICVEPPIETHWLSLYTAINSVLRYDLVAINKLMIALAAPQFTTNDFAFLKEFVGVVEPITSALDNLQSNGLYAVLLPTLKTLRDYLNLYQSDNDLRFCAPLADAIHGGFNERFKDFFDTTNEKCVSATIAACTHPFFKLRWTDADFMGDNYIETITEMLISAAAKCNTNPDDTQVNTATQASTNSTKKFKYSFASSPATQQSDGNRLIRMEVLSYLNAPASEEETDLTQLNNFTNIRRIFIKFNTLLTSSASAEQMFPFNKICSLQNDPSMSNRTIESIFMLNKNSSS